MELESLELGLSKAMMISTRGGGARRSDCTYLWKLVTDMVSKIQENARGLELSTEDDGLLLSSFCFGKDHSRNRIHEHCVIKPL